MKKISLYAFLLFCTIGFGQIKGQAQSTEIKAPTIIYTPTAELPASYLNNPATTVSENVDVVSNVQRAADVSVPFTGTYYNSMEPNALLYHNGPYWNTPGTPKKSVLESVTLGMNSIGSQAKIIDGTSIADDVGFADDVEVTSIDLFAYQTGSTVPSITAAYLKVWNGNPTEGASIIWGDFTTNILDDVVYAEANRVTETEPNDETRQIQRVTVLTPGLTLSAGIYWIEFTFEGSGDSGPWTPPIVISGENTTGNAIQNQNGMYVFIKDSGTDTPQGLPFIIYGNITGGGTFPEPYCALDYLTIEPITLVEVANISHSSSDAIDDSPALEDFTAIVGNMREEESYAITLEGNTNGDNINSFTVFLDWNQDGDLDNAGERFEIGTIQNSTGTDGIQATSTITVPIGAVGGPTRMRVMKNLGTDYATNSCTGFFGQAEDYTINVTIATFPDPYCGPIEYTIDVEPITLVELTGISNVTDAAINGAPAHEDFTAIVGEMEEGMSYDIAIEGNTGGYTNSFTVFIDWNQDGVLDNEGERYEIGFIDDSDGTDGQQATGNITVPSGVTDGPTRMRIIKRFTSSGIDFAENSCTPGSNYGQAADYTIDVTALVGLTDNDLLGLSYYPNPTSNLLSLKSANIIYAVAIYNLLGKKVLDTKIGAPTSEISLSGLASGTYIMHVSVEGQTVTYKVLKN